MLEKSMHILFHLKLKNLTKSEEWIFFPLYDLQRCLLSFREVCILPKQVYVGWEISYPQSSALSSPPFFLSNGDNCSSNQWSPSFDFNSWTFLCLFLCLFSAILRSGLLFSLYIKRMESYIQIKHDGL